MNKTIIINISGIIFHIEEDAYDVLRNYMNEVKKHFGNSADSFEIVSDIENRIAEMFNGILNSNEKQVIVLEDVKSIILQMGSTSDFEENNIESETKINAAESIKKRLYRNPDDKILGGVCSGASAYFKTDPLWIRLVLALSVFFFGSGVILYLILWVIMPEAKTRTEKLAMRGESPTIENIKKSIEEEFGHIRKNANDSYNDIKSYGGVDQIRLAISKVVEGIGSVLKFIVTAIGKLLALFVIVGSGVAGFALTFTFLAVLGVVDNNDIDFNWFLVSPDYQASAYTAWYAIVMIPVIAIFLLGVRLLINVNPFNKFSGLSMISLWVLALFVGGYYAIETASEFKEVGRLKSNTEILPSSVGKYYLVTDQSYQAEETDSLKTKKYGINGKVIVKSSKKHFIFDDIDINIEKSFDEKPHLITIYNSRGREEQSAIRYAENIQYDFKQIDSLLVFPETFRFKEKVLWRKQAIEMTLFLPSNSQIIISDNADRYIHNIYSGNCRRTGRSETEWMMTKDGLTCTENPKDEE